MWKIAGWIGVVVALAASFLIWNSTKRADAQVILGSNMPVVIELFTSQGCSSCPPADRVLSRIGSELAEASVYPLSFHVDYWNYIGWQDPFSSTAWSDRQKQYAAAKNSKRIYTPQLIVSGGKDCVGSKERCVRGAIADAKRSSPRGRVDVEKLRLVEDGAALELSLLASGAGEKPLRVMLAVHTSAMRTEVKRGENRGDTLRNDFVVRELLAAMEIPAGSSDAKRKTLRIPLDKAWGTRALGVTAFLQEEKSLRILNADRLMLRPRSS